MRLLPRFTRGRAGSIRKTASFWITPKLPCLHTGFVTRFGKLVRGYTSGLCTGKTASSLTLQFSFRLNDSTSAFDLGGADRRRTGGGSAKSASLNEPHTGCGGSAESSDSFRTA